MRFIRKNGRVIPIEDNEPPSATKVAAVAGAAGATYHIGEELHYRGKVNAAENIRNVKDFQKQLKPGDILTLGSTSKHSSGIRLKDATSMLPKALQKPLLKAGQAIGLHPQQIIVSNSNLLTALGAGDRYHAGIYVGNGKVIHMSTDQGAVKEDLADVLYKQNTTAMRFKNQTAQETKSAVQFARNAVKKKTQYQKFGEYIKSASVSMVMPVGQRPSQSCGRMVCHTLPIRAFHKRPWGMNGEQTFAGEFKKVSGMDIIARRNVIRSASLDLKSLAGVGLKGLKWGAIAGGGVLAYKGAQALHNRVKGRKHG